MTYLIVGLDRRTLAPWQRHVRERDVASATRAAVARAGADGVDLVVAAVIGPDERAGHNAALCAPRGATTPTARRPSPTPVPDATTDELQQHQFIAPIAQAPR
jgi:hypothetical protein